MTNLATMALHYIKTGGGSLAVYVRGENGPLVITHPGMGDTRDAYDPLAAQLVAQGYRVASIDARGHGDSSVVFDKYGDEAASEDFVTVAEKMGDGRPVVLAGASFSGGAAVMAAGKRPDLVAGIILFAPFCRNPIGEFGRSVFQVLFWRPWGPAAWKFYAKTLYPGLGKQKAAERAAASKTSLTRPGGRWAAFQKTVRGCDHRLVGPWLGKVKAPVLVVFGDKDPDWSKPLEEAAWVASHFSDVESVTAAGCGHAPMLESPEFVGEKVLGYLDRLRSRGILGA